MTVRLRCDQATLLVVDVQTKLLPHIRHADRVVAATAALLEGARLFELPVTVTVQYVAGLGPTHERLAEVMARDGIQPLEKMCFSVCGDAPARARLEALARPQVIVAGIEGHVCVAQTVLDLLAAGRQVIVCRDAVSSRYKTDLKAALCRMAQAGAVITTTEAVLFELCALAGTPQFKKLLAIIKKYDEARK